MGIEDDDHLEAMASRVDMRKKSPGSRSGRSLQICHVEDSDAKGSKPNPTTAGQEKSSQRSTMRGEHPSATTRHSNTSNPSRSKISSRPATSSTGSSSQASSTVRNRSVPSYPDRSPQTIVPVYSHPEVSETGYDNSVELERALLVEMEEEGRQNHSRKPARTSASSRKGGTESRSQRVISPILRSQATPRVRAVSERENRSRSTYSSSDEFPRGGSESQIDRRMLRQGMRMERVLNEMDGDSRRRTVASLRGHSRQDVKSGVTFAEEDVVWREGSDECGNSCINGAGRNERSGGESRVGREQDLTKSYGQSSLLIGENSKVVRDRGYRRPSSTSQLAPMRKTGGTFARSLFSFGKKLMRWPEGVAPLVLYARDSAADGTGRQGLCSTLLAKIEAMHMREVLVRKGEKFCVRVVGSYVGGEIGLGRSVWSFVRGGKGEGRVVHSEGNGNGLVNVEDWRGLVVSGEGGGEVWVSFGMDVDGREGKEGQDVRRDVRWRVVGEDEQSASGRFGVAMRYGYYFFLAEPCGLRLFTQVDTPEHVRLVVVREDGNIDEEVSKSISYLVIRVGRD